MDTKQVSLWSFDVGVIALFQSPGQAMGAGIAIVGGRVADLVDGSRGRDYSDHGLTDGVVELEPPTTGRTASGGDHIARYRILSGRAKRCRREERNEYRQIQRNLHESSLLVSTPFYYFTTHWCHIAEFFCNATHQSCCSDRQTNLLNS